MIQTQIFISADPPAPLTTDSYLNQLDNGKVKIQNFDTRMSMLNIQAHGVNTESNDLSG